MGDLGIVVIGRNEGDRLRRCLDSLGTHAPPVVYVDSGSTDESVSLARSRSAEVVALDMSIPFTASRARNAGVGRLREVAPDVAYVQFIDGDCEIMPGWLDQGRDVLKDRADVAIVAGALRERDPEASTYNRLADVEWSVPAGETDYCGGVAMARMSAFTAVGGFDETVAAGEELEMCGRLMRDGWKALRVDAPMALHDMAMTRFGQWWRRQVRGGYGAYDVVARFGDRSAFRGFRQQIRSSRAWALGWPAAVLVAALLGTWRGGPLSGACAAALVALVLPAQALRLAWKARRKLPDLRLALTHGCLTMLAKWAYLLGQLTHIADAQRGRRARLIEHKDAGLASGPT